MATSVLRTKRLLQNDLQLRLATVKSLLGRSSCKHALFTTAIDVEYLSGFHSSNMLCLISQKANILFSDFRYAEAGRTWQKRNKSWKFIEIHQNDFSFLKQFLPNNSIVAIQDTVMTLDEHRRLKRTMTNAGKKIKFVNMPVDISDALVPKTAQELAYMKNAASIADKAFMALLSHIRIGMTELEVAAYLDTFCKAHGSQRPSFDTIVLFGKRAALPHGEPSDVRLKRGDWVLCDFGCTVRGLCSDMTRTFVMGKATARQREIYDIVSRAQETGKALVQSGMRACDVDAVVRKIIGDAGYGKCFGHGTGHGVGRRVHERPRLSRNDNSILQTNTVVTVEPGIYDPAFGGVRIEDMVAVTVDGCNVMTQAPRALMEVAG